MFEWIIPLITSVIGAGAGTMFNKILDRPLRPRSVKEPPPNSLAGVIRTVTDMQEWQAKAEEMFRIQDREIRRLKRDIKVYRWVVDAFMAVLLLSLLAWYYFNKKS
jgi:hypothetical protein